jgi:hypothetical protein
LPNDPTVQYTSTMTKSQWFVHLGPGWKRFSAPRTDLELLGTIQHGPQIGALGKLPDGRYVQVNGDVFSPVNTYKVEAAIQAAGSRPARRPAFSAPSTAGEPEPPTAAMAPMASTAPTTPVTITFRKRRTVALPDGAP